MTKKRFIKLLMSRGKSKNEAVEIALNYNNLNYSYKSAYAAYLLKYSMSDALHMLTYQFSKLSMSVAQASKAFSKLATAVAITNER
jgi:hypothetical protein